MKIAGRDANEPVNLFSDFLDLAALAPLTRKKPLYAIDWAVKKKLQIYDIQKDKLKSIPATLGAFEKFLHNKKETQFYFEEGGGDSFKLQAERAGHEVFTIPGKQIKGYRDELRFAKSDTVDAVILGKFARTHPEEFYQFQPLDEITARIAILFKERLDTEKTLVRTKNRLFALKIRLELINLDGYKDKVIKRKENVIKALEEEFKDQTKLLFQEVKKHPLNNYFEGIKGIGPATAAGLIATIKRGSRFDDKYSLRHFAGMVKKKGDQNFNHSLKRTLYFFCTAIIKNRTPFWRELYDKMKVYYKNKHPDWKKSRVNSYAMKFVETKFLDSVYKRIKEIGEKGVLL